uniref:Small integral membrane protein 20-like n=1 Tax=Moschus moschiferus TaxID=68415 RepID=A0A8C6DV47_MOSMO
MAQTAGAGFGESQALGESIRVARNLSTALIFRSFIFLIGVAFYSIYCRPLLRLEEYKGTTINRAGIVQEDVQPSGLKVWSDPFGRK